MQGGLPDELPYAGGEDLAVVAASVPSSSKAEQNSKARRTTLQWLKSRPLDELMLLRSVLQPLVVLMHAQLGLSSDEWEMEQRSNVARVISESGVAPRCTRDYRVLLAAEGVFEQRCF